jgi:hypothetical protein
MNDKKTDVVIVTRDDIIEFLDDKILNADCSQCSTNNWALEGGGENENVQLLISKKPGFSSVIPCSALICWNCGYVKVFAKYAVEKHLISEKV